MGFSNIVDLVKMPIRAVGDMLDLMTGWGILEATELYFVEPGEFRHTPPPSRRYRGFEWGYRKHNKRKTS